MNVLKSHIALLDLIRNSNIYFRRHKRRTVKDVKDDNADIEVMTIVIIIVKWTSGWITITQKKRGNCEEVSYCPCSSWMSSASCSIVAGVRILELPHLWRVADYMTTPPYYLYNIFNMSDRIRWNPIWLNRPLCRHDAVQFDFRNA